MENSVTQAQLEEFKAGLQAAVMEVLSKTLTLPTADVFARSLLQTAFMEALKTDAARLVQKDVDKLVMTWDAEQGGIVVSGPHEVMERLFVGMGTPPPPGWTESVKIDVVVEL